MATTRTELRDRYRAEVKSFVLEVLRQRGWSRAEAARRLDKPTSTISRAAGGLFDTEYTTVMALAQVSGVPIPSVLSDAATARSMPMREAPSSEAVTDLVEEVLSASPDRQRAVFEELAKRFGGVKA